MNRAAIIALGVIALGLMGYILVFEQGSLSSGELEKRRGHLLESFVRDRVSRLEIERGGRTLRLSREGGADDGFAPWSVQAPWEDQADEEAVNALLGELEWLDARRRIQNASDADLKRFGLDAPRIRLRFTAGRSEGLLEVGARDVHEEGLYVRVDGQPDVSVVPKTLDEVLDHPLSHFRTKQFLGDVTVAWARHVEIHAGSREAVIEREGERFWFEPAPRSFGDRRAIDDWLRSFDDLRATRYVTEDQVAAAREGLEASRDHVLVKIIPDEGREDAQVRILDLRVGGDCPGHDDERTASLGKSSPVVCVRDADVETLLGDPEALRLRTPFGFDPSEIERLHLESGDDSLTLSRDEDKWVTPAGEDASIARLTVESWLADLADQRALAVHERSEGPTRASLEVELAGGGEARLELGAPGLEGSVVRRDGEPAQWTFDRVTADLLSYWPGRFRPLRLWELQPSEVVALEVRGRDGASRTLRLEEGEWREQGHDGPAADAARVREVVRTFAKMDAERIRAPRPEPQHGLAAPLLELEARLEGGRELRLRLGELTESPERYFAQLDDGVVVELSVENASALRELLLPAPSDEATPEAANTKPAPPSDDDEEHGHEDHGH